VTRLLSQARRAGWLLGDDAEVHELRCEEAARQPSTCAVSAPRSEHHPHSRRRVHPGRLTGRSAIGDRGIADAHEVLADLLHTTGGTDGMIGVELPPPSGRSQWDRQESVERRPAGTHGVRSRAATDWGRRVSRQNRTDTCSDGRDCGRLRSPQRQRRAGTRERACRCYITVMMCEVPTASDRP
jgi:hypothetical protein